jgi:hypothetical protein
MLSSEAGTHKLSPIFCVSAFLSIRFIAHGYCWWSDDWMVYHLGDNTSKQE